MAHALSKTMACALALFMAHPAAAQPRMSTARTMAGLPLSQVAGHGAKVPFVEY